MSLPLAGKVALITGSSRGIGAAVATRLAADGASVVINYVSNADAAQGVADGINAKGAGKATIIKADVSVLSEAKRLVDETREKLGGLDILVLNAAIMQLRTLAELTEADYDLHYNANVKGPLFMTQHAVPHLKPGSRVIFFSSSLTRASGVTPNYLLYISTKGAIEQMARALAKDLGGKGINVNTVSPGPIDTDLFRNGKPPQLIQFFENLHPAKRLGQPEEVAKAVAFMASEDASWVNGQTLMVNGGFAL